MKKYEKYKDSGVKWLGEIPEHWEAIRLANVGRFSSSGIDKFILKNQSIVKIINYTDVYRNSNFSIDSKIEFMEVTTPENNRIKNLVKKGDLIFLPSSETFEDLGLCALIDEEFENLSFSYHVLRFEFKKEIVHNFKKYFTNNSTILNEFSKKGTGSIRKTLNRNDFRNIVVFLPPLSEQTAIANFLDDKTAKIDQAIAIKEKEINLLKERRQILIQKAVTKGLNPNTKLKHSGVEWIGEIPEHWEVRKLKYVLTMRNEKIESKTTEKIYVGMENIESQTGKYFSTDSQVEGLANIFYKNDILFGKLRPYLAKVYLSEFDGICSTEFLVYKSVNSSYYQKVLLSDIFIKLVDSSTYGAKMPRASADFINNISIPTPPEKEKTQIVSYLEDIEEKIAKAISLKQQEIEKLKEYKTVLIDNVVTGKVKVSAN